MSEWICASPLCCDVMCGSHWSTVPLARMAFNAMSHIRYFFGISFRYMLVPYAFHLLQTYKNGLMTLRSKNCFTSNNQSTLVIISGGSWENNFHCFGEGRYGELSALRWAINDAFLVDSLIHLGALKIFPSWITSGNKKLPFKVLIKREGKSRITPSYFAYTTKSSYPLPR